MNFDLSFLTNIPNWMPLEYWRYLSQYPIFILGLMITLFLTPFFGYVAIKNNIVNETKGDTRKRLNRFDNQERRINPNPTPLLGGLSILIPLIAVIIASFGFGPITTPLLISLVILLIGGIFDDMYNIPATTQFLIQFIAAAIIAISVIDLATISIPLDGVIHLDSIILQTDNFLFPIRFLVPGDIIMIIWIMIVINAIKWVGGIDALMEGTLSIAFILIYIIGIRTGSELVIITSLYMVGSLLGFIFYNFPPAKIFTGSTGKTAFGFLVATLSLIGDTKVAITIMIILLPIIDFVFVLMKRLLMNKPKSVNELLRLPINLMRTSDTNHLHHQLLRVGLSVRQILFIEISLTLLIGMVAVLTTEAYRLFLVMGFGLVVMLLILFLHIYSNKREKKLKRTQQDTESPESRYSY